MFFGRRKRKDPPSGEPAGRARPTAQTGPPCPSCGWTAGAADPHLVCPDCGMASDFVVRALAVQTLREGRQSRVCDGCEQVTLVIEPDMACPDCRRLHPDVNERLRAQYAASGPGDPGDAPCVGCGYFPEDETSPFLDLLIDCQGCGDEIAVPESDFTHGEGMQLQCGKCAKVTLVPDTIWCPKCGRHLRRLGIPELVREANHRAR